MVRRYHHNNVPGADYEALVAEMAESKLAQYRQLSHELATIEALLARISEIESENALLRVAARPLVVSGLITSEIELHECPYKVDIIAQIKTFCATKVEIIAQIKTFCATVDRKRPGLP